MANSIENSLLVELDQPNGKVLRIIRSYMSERRAQQDLELVRELNPGQFFDTLCVEHIDD